MQEAVVKAWVSEGKAKVLFESSKNPFTKSGTYFLTRDGGQTLLLVNPKDKSYSRWDMDAMAQMVAGFDQMAKFEVSEGKVELLEQRPGEPVAGMPTTYYKFRTSYRQKMQFMMFKQDNRVEEIRELWTAPQLVEKAMEIYLRKTPPKTVSDDINRLMQMEFEKVKGVPLKMRTVTTIQNKSGKTDTNVVTMEVLTLQMLPVPDATFQLPADYKEVQLLPTGGEGGEGADNPMRQLFGGKKGS